MFGDSADARLADKRWVDVEDAGEPREQARRAAMLALSDDDPWADGVDELDVWVQPSEEGAAGWTVHVTVRMTAQIVLDVDTTEGEGSRERSMRCRECDEVLLRVRTVSGWVEVCSECHHQVEGSCS